MKLSSLLIPTLLAVACSTASATATYSWSFQGQGDFTDTFGSGTFTVAAPFDIASPVQSPQPVLSWTGSYSDTTDKLYGLTPVPIIGIVAQPGPSQTIYQGCTSNCPPHFSYDNLIGWNGVVFSNGGVLFNGLQEKSNGFFDDQIDYVNLYTDFIPDGHGSGSYGVFADVWLPTYAAGDFVVPVDFSYHLIDGGIPAVPEPPAAVMAALGLLALAVKRKIC